MKMLDLKLCTYFINGELSIVGFDDATLSICGKDGVCKNYEKKKLINNYSKILNGESPKYYPELYV